jgi:hypothetical protein
MTREEPVKPKRTRKAKEEHLCLVHDECDDNNRISIRKSVCRDLETTEHIDRNHYCLLHLPTKAKHSKNFQQIIDGRFKEVAAEVTKIETEQPESDWKKAKRLLRYDFRYVWFPPAPIVNFFQRTFLVKADFEFSTFVGTASFHKADFQSEVKFKSATFSSFAIFVDSTFMAKANFNEAKFTNIAAFENAKFKELADFSAVRFEENSELKFNRTIFYKTVDFRFARFKGFVYFEGKNDERLLVGDDVLLDFKGAMIDDAEKISFHTVRLRPNWFVNVDSRKCSFTNISWENHKASNKELTEELESLKKRKHKEPDNFRLLTIAFRNLATNAEEFNRLEDASNFRESAFECEKLERKHKQKDWLSNVSKTLDKKFICWNFFSETKTIITELWKSIKHAPFDLVHFLYRLLSFYGESWFRATWILFAVWFGFALFYFYFGEFGTDEKHKPLEFLYSLGYSLQVMTLQKPEPKPYGSLTVLLYGMETILAPLQAALLALAIRRKFMR